MLEKNYSYNNILSIKLITRVFQIDNLAILNRFLW